MNQAEATYPADSYRLTALLYDWGDCLYLVRPFHLWAHWMSHRHDCLEVLRRVMNMRDFCDVEGEHPDEDEIVLSLAANSEKDGFSLYHLSGNPETIKWTESAMWTVPPLRITQCTRSACGDGTAVPIYRSGWDSLEPPRLRDLVASGI